MWFIGVEVEQETSAPPPKKNPGSVPGEVYKRGTYSKMVYKNGPCDEATPPPPGRETSARLLYGE